MCSKTHYSTRKHAKIGAKFLKSKGATVRFRVYKCDCCDGFHLTSYSAEKAAYMKDK